ncbi:MAG: S-formylglutathione hydrolase [Pseudomonadota bacterium]
MQTVSESRCFGGTQGVYTHTSSACACDMTFGLFLPEAAQNGPVPLLWFLAGLTCTHENAMNKAGAQAWAAQHGLALIFPDTSPRGDGVADDEAYDLGQGAGFYVNATQTPWAPHFKMWDYVSEELPSLVAEHFAIDMSRQAITGHSMGGHGALTLAMGLPGRFRSASAFAPIANPTAGEWGIKQLTAYLGDDTSAWARHDSALLMVEQGFDGPLLVDQGASDQFLGQLMPEKLSAAMGVRRQPGAFRMQPGYDHSYFFVSSFMQDHVAFHAEALGAV